MSSSSASTLTASQSAANEALPRYRCHKVVQAARVLRVDLESDRDTPLLHLDPEPVWPGPVDPCEKVRTSATEIRVLVRAFGYDWIQKHKPEAGGFVVVYEDGYTSYSPAKAFEEGYALLAGERDVANELRNAAAEIRALRRSNEVLRAKVDVLGFFQRVFENQLPRGYGGDEARCVDVAYQLERRAEKMSA